MKYRTLWENLITIFRDVFASTSKIFLLLGGLDTRLSFPEV